MKRAIIILMVLIGIKGYSQNAPLTTISSARTCSSTIITLKVTQTNVKAIAGFGLRLDYDAAVLSFINPNPLFLAGNFYNTNSAMYAYNGDISVIQSDYIYLNGFKKVRCFWGGTNPSTLGIVPDTTIGGIAQILDLTFRYYGGSTTILFNNSNGIGQLCEWSDEIGVPYIDNPTEMYYRNGMVTECTNTI